MWEQPMSAHWGVEDPAAFEGTPADQRKAFSSVFLTLSRRIGQVREGH